MKKTKIVLAASLAIMTLGVSAVFASDEDKASEFKASEKTIKECEIPMYAKLIGHEDLWLKHNGCPPREKSQEKQENQKSPEGQKSQEKDDK